jgi:hypothetical protein
VRRGDADATAVAGRHLRRISGLPCWGVTAEYGSWLGLNFGQPTLEVIEAASAIDSPTLGRRRVFVQGEHRLWVDLCNWEIFENSRRRFHSGQRRASLRRAAARLEGQILRRFSLQLRPLGCAFAFDEGSVLVMRRRAKAQRDDELWHFYSPRTYLSLRSDAQLEFGRLQSESLSRCRASELQLEL